MSHSEREVYLHFVWATKYRMPILPPSQERAIYRVLSSQIAKTGCKTIAINGTEDHIHILIKLGPDVSLSRLANQFKGATAHFINETRDRENDSLFQWQDGYGVFSVGKNQINRVANYIKRQKERHAANRLWESLEPSEPLYSPQMSQTNLSPAHNTDPTKSITQR